MKNLKKIAIIMLTCIGTGLLTPSCNSGSTSSTATGSDAVDLKLNFKAGDKFLYSTQIDQKIESIASMDQSMLMEMVYAYTGDDGGDKKLAITYDHIVMNTTSPMGKMEYDSKNTQPRERGMATMDSLIGKSFTITVAPDGTIKKVEGMDDLINSMVKPGESELAGNPFTDSTVKLMMQNSFDIYPGKKVKIGETWVKKSQMGFANVKVDVENTYTLKSVDDSKATIAVASILTLPKTAMGQAGALQMNGTQNGTLEVDIATGQIISGKTKQDIKGSMSIQGLGQTVPMNIKGDIVISSKKL